MRAYLLQRLVQFFGVIFGASIIVFFAMNWATDPVELILPLGASQAEIDRLRDQLGLNDPILIQYLRFLGDAVRGDFGTSLWIGGPALDAALARLPATAMIVLPATFIGVLIGGAIGLAAGMRPGSRLDDSVNVVSYGALSIAEFWLGIMFILLFAVQLGWFPSGGFEASWRALAMPVAVLAIRPFAQTAQMMRSVVVAESRKQYVVTARSKGIDEMRVAVSHVLRNASIPVLTLSMYNLSRLFVGTAIAVEVVFAWPGIGRLAVGALQRGDLFLVQAIVIVAAAVVAALNLIADLLYFWLDPRTRSLVKEKA